jgi:hypothetical protein
MKVNYAPPHNMGKIGLIALKDHDLRKIPPKDSVTVKCY